MDLIGDGKHCEDICKHSPPEKGKWPCEDCDMRVHDRAEPPKQSRRRRNERGDKRSKNENSY